MSGRDQATDLAVSIGQFSDAGRKDANQDFTRYTIRNITGSLALNANDSAGAPKAQH